MSVDITVADTAQLGVEQVYWHLRQSNKKKQAGFEVPHSKSKFQSGVYSARQIYMVGWVIPSGNNTISWLHLASWNLQDFQLSWKFNLIFLPTLTYLSN